ncbi:PREDICTED: interleukin-1 receptor type 1-like isoform X2 [Poecilia mexicana]|uniref:interleukin-1 receptor type 1-like isoform X2 n=1 Tax=Poecilia mexicana TaxID=48701 RepID=UPI00072DA927|nr:PREDICTED: interleukin-1 receptor type 1-like isoform X2 [Poecilia mexicana]
MIPLLLVLLTGICPVTTNEIYANAGDLVMLNCRESKHNSTEMPWKMETDQKMQLYGNMSAFEQQQLGLVLYQRSLVILRASANHQGNYSCGPRGNTSSQIWFRLTVCPKQSTVCTSRNKYRTICHAKQACKLSCPEGSIPNVGIPGMKSMEDVWHKENGEPSDNYFPSVGLEKSGVYICKRSFSYSGEIYQTSSSVELDVKAVEHPTKLGIYLPKNGQIFEVELGTKKEIVCKALVNSCQNSPYWTSEGEFVDDSDVHTDPCNGSEKMPKCMSTTLIFREVSPGNLSKTFTCVFSSDKLTSRVNITLVKKAQPSKVMLAVCSVCVVVLMAAIVVVYVKFKIDVTLFLRDKVGFKDCQSSTSDEKSYDAFLMCYKSVTDGGLSEEDRKCLASTLEDEFGYSICLYDRDVLPGQAIAEAVLDCIEQSRAVVLVPSFPDPEPGSAVLSAIHTSLVERKTRLIFINTEQTETEASRSGSFPEALQLLSKAGNSVTWKGRPPSTSFWKQLRYHLPAPQQTPKMQLLSQEC